MPEEFENLPHDRRSMFRFGLKRLMEPLAEYIAERMDVSFPTERTVLRPPGALPENEFLDTCYRCGNCVEVCPATAIRTINSDDPEMAGTPYIDPDLAACVVCDELACMKSCPSGALKLVKAPLEISMGRSKVNYSTCLRSHQQDCTVCLDKCPLAEQAIALDEKGKIQVQQGCVGCGTCQFYCPTSPKSITVEPH